MRNQEFEKPAPPTVFIGEYPHTQVAINSYPVGSDQSSRMIRDNLYWVLTGRTREIRVERIIAQDWSGKRKLQKLISQGWTVDRTSPRRMLRGDIYVFSRPLATREERDVMGW